MAENLHDNQMNFLEEAVEQFVDAQLRGEKPVIDEFVKKYTEFEHQVRKRIQKLQKIDTLFASLVKTDESDFEVITDEHDLVGKKVGSFEIVKIIGRGGMGVVYLARDTKLKRSVAVKSIPAAMAGDSTARTRFRREAELLASLNHPNIAVIHDIIEQDGGAGYLVLEYVPGETLAEHITREPLKLKEALSISQQIAEAITVAHKKGIVHRDLKPGNIKITPEGRVKVLDFGLAKATATQGKKGEITETHPGRVIGTPAYMSPEQARGKETDHRTDIWSFGCIMYQMLTGQLPFEGETATDTLARIIEREPDWELLPQDTPANIRTLLQRCLEKDPERRLGDIADAAREISETLSKPQTAPTAKLRRIAMIISAVIIIAGISVLALLLTSNEQYPTENTEAYGYYLRGNEYYNRRYVESDLSNAILMYERALALDPNLAQAYAQLSRAHSMMYWHYDHSDSRLIMAEKAVNKALQLDPDLPEAHLALGHYYFQGLRDYDSALEQFVIVLKSQPNSSESLSFAGFIQRRQGKFEQALANIKKAYELNSLSNNLAIEVGLTYMFLRKYPQAIRYCEKAILLTPDDSKAYNLQAQVYLRWQQSTEKAQAVLEEALKNAKGAEYPSIIHSLIDVDVFDRNYQEALDRLSLISEDVDDVDNTGYFFPNALRFAQICGYMQNKDLAKKYYNDARIFLESKIAEQPEKARFHSLLGIVYAGLDYKEEAIREGKLAVEMLPVSKDATVSLLFIKNLAHIYCMAGEYDLAIEQLKYLLSIPGELSIPLLRLDPAWDPLRNHPRFKKLVEQDK